MYASPEYRFISGGKKRVCVINYLSRKMFPAHLNDWVGKISESRFCLKKKLSQWKSV